MNFDFTEQQLESEIMQVPERVRRFLFKEDAPSAQEQSWGYYAHGYSFAFDELAEMALREWPRREYLRLPVFFLGRHSMELAIKEAIVSYEPHTSQTALLKGHGLSPIGSVHRYD
jgi:hypothetical protein